MAHLTLERVPEGVALQIGDVFPLTAESTYLGRDTEPPADGSGLIHLPHHSVSRRHAVIVRADDVFRIRDLRSRGRTFVNGRAVQSDAGLPLLDGDKIKICDLYFVFGTGAPAPGGETGAPTDPN